MPSNSQQRIQEVQSTLSCADKSMPFRIVFLEDFLQSAEEIREVQQEGGTASATGASHFQPLICKYLYMVQEHQADANANQIQLLTHCANVLWTLPPQVVCFSEVSFITAAFCFVKCRLLKVQRATKT